MSTEDKNTAHKVNCSLLGHKILEDSMLHDFGMTMNVDGKTWYITAHLKEFFVGIGETFIYDGLIFTCDGWSKALSNQSVLGTAGYSKELTISFTIRGSGSKKLK